MAVFLPSILFLSVLQGTRRLYSWIAADWNAADKKDWRLLVIRVLACMGLVAGTGVVSAIAIPALLTALL
ncbi:hypothetical protein Desku_0793 [Desulfofundulus kuznetsovii DSM 6115]|uniref:Uncharacterized protein n=1 Tax=Desulfofundulus kuznetsovii (strain DSM 6115 / VKM B-1805 / 17) TaxID=760568 RepID=A0AAU8P8A3_DESK7|nr:hypothetical protein Desku_0793 [Desulfofundulus kuznetsovii DSM 6115]